MDAVIAVVDGEDGAIVRDRHRHRVVELLRADLPPFFVPVAM